MIRAANGAANVRVQEYGDLRSNVRPDYAFEHRSPTMLAIAERASSAIRQIAQVRVQNGPIAPRGNRRDVLWRRVPDMPSVDGLGDPVFVLSPDGILLYANSIAAEVLGWIAADMIGTSVIDLVHPTDVEPRARLAADGGDQTRR